MDLSIFRPKSIEEIYSFRIDAGQEFDKYLQEVYKYLLRMKPGSEFDILRSVNPKNHEWFIKSCCIFILEGGSDYEFSNDYLRLKRLDSRPEEYINELNKLLKKKKHELEATKTRNREIDLAGENG